MPSLLGGGWFLKREGRGALEGTEVNVRVYARASAHNRNGFCGFLRAVEVNDWKSWAVNCSFTRKGHLIVIAPSPLLPGFSTKEKNDKGSSKV